MNKSNQAHKLIQDVINTHSKSTTIFLDGECVYLRRHKKKLEYKWKPIGGWMSIADGTTVYTLEQIIKAHKRIEITDEPWSFVLIRALDYFNVSLVIVGAAVISFVLMS